jgi:hypothetical protein
MRLLPWTLQWRPSAIAGSVKRIHSNSTQTSYMGWATFIRRYVKLDIFVFVCILQIRTVN